MMFRPPCMHCVSQLHFWGSWHFCRCRDISWRCPGPGEWLVSFSFWPATYQHCTPRFIRLAIFARLTRLKVRSEKREACAEKCLRQ
jgi:hypothetical protein